MFRKLTIVAAASILMVGAVMSAQAQAKKYSMNGSAYISVDGKRCRVDARASNVSGFNDARIWVLDSRLVLCGSASIVDTGVAENGKLTLNMPGTWLGQRVAYRFEVTAGRTLQNSFKLEVIGNGWSKVLHNGPPLAGFMYLFLF